MGIGPSVQILLPLCAKLGSEDSLEGFYNVLHHVLYNTSSLAASAGLREAGDKMQALATKFGGKFPFRNDQKYAGVRQHAKTKNWDKILSRPRDSAGRLIKR